MSASERQARVDPAGVVSVDRFREVLGHFASGVVVVTALDDGEPIGMTVQSFASLSLDPPLVVFCPAVTSTTWPRVRAVGRFAINLLAEGQDGVALQFARSGGPKYDAIEWRPGPLTGAPILENGLAWLESNLTAEHPGGDHSIAVCSIESLHAHLDRHPLLFFRSTFCRTEKTGRPVSPR